MSACDGGRLWLGARRVQARDQIRFSGGAEGTSPRRRLTSATNLARALQLL